ncbi:MAG: substrate-binding domain-containing protein, partial [Lautropia sp.]
LVQAMNSAGLVVTTLGPRFLNAPVFSVDNVAAGAAAAEHLVKAGHRRIGIVTGHLRSETARQRYEGSLAVLRSHAARVTVRHTEFVDESVTGAIAALLGESPDVTGIIAGSDYMARIVVDWLNRHGLAVPRDMSVVGIGNTTVGSAPAVRLTTVDMHLAECASAALNCIAGADPGSAAFSPPMPRVIAGDTVTHPAAARGPAGADETGRSGSEQPIARRGGRRESGRTARLQSEAANEPTST